jgi:hypothetical protein
MLKFEGKKVKKRKTIPYPTELTHQTCEICHKSGITQ